jgi:basic amino acid/polyamine antiporter, APA family
MSDRVGSTPSRDLTLLDFTLLVIGAVVGADVYVVAAIGAGLLGPAQLVAWIIAGLLAAIIGIAFVQCATVQPRVGGSYAYVRSAFGPLVGFLAGWALYVGEWIALPVFPVAFSNYLTYFVPDLSPTGSLIVKAALIAAVLISNIAGARASARLNDVLTVAKLLPLVVLIVAGVALIALRPDVSLAHLRPFAPLGWSGLGPAVLVIFWAYAGFELAVLPAGEVRDARHTLPRGLIIGMSIATVFYVLTAFAVVVAIPSTTAANSPRSLADALDSIAGAFGLQQGFGGVLMSLGALISIAGVFEVFMLGVARLSYALARDGLFPRPFAQLSPRFGTPYVGLVFQAVAAAVLANVFDLTHLIDSAMLFLGVCYALTALAALRLVQQNPHALLHVPGLQAVLTLAAVSGVALALQAPPQLLALGAAVMAVGLVVYLVRRRAWSVASVEAGLREEELHLAAWLLHFLRRRAYQ